MEPQIVTKPSFIVVGLPFTGFTHAPYEGGQQKNEISLVWDQLNARVGEIKNICGPSYGLCIGLPNEREPWYIAGFEVAQAGEVPTGMMSWAVPAQKYFVFPCTLGTLGATYRYINEESQPRTGHEHADAPEFELYDEEPEAGDPQHMKLSVYWPFK